MTTITHEKFDSSDSNVSKFVFTFTPEVHKDKLVQACFNKKEAVAEAVLYKYGSYKERTVICCSVQSGCPVGCSFCGTGKFFIRDLTTAEIIHQVETCLSTIDCEPSEIQKFQIMFMSMGEPFLAGWEYIDWALRRLHENYPNADLLISTSAPERMVNVLPRFINLCKEIPKIGLQFSVHESTDEARKELIPTKTSTLRQIAAMGQLWAVYVGRKPFFNYCVHEDNSGIDDAQRLEELFNPYVWECTLSVICEADETMKSSINRQLELINRFNRYMQDCGFNTRVFNPAGQDDIGGGCGQLWWFQKWLDNENKRIS